MSTLRERVAAPDPQLELSIWEPGEKHEALYREHRSQYPEVYRRLVVIARELRAEGWERCSFRMIWETLRLRYGPHAKDRYGFGLNDWMSRFYSRALMAENADLSGMFETRERA